MDETASRSSQRNTVLHLRRPAVCNRGLTPRSSGCMSRAHKTLRRILDARADASIRFEDLVTLLRQLGFQERIRGGHHIFTRRGIEEILNLQPKGFHAKPYQVRQLRQVIRRYGLGGDDER
jgi:hypothetical protein